MLDMRRLIRWVSIAIVPIGAAVFLRQRYTLGLNLADAVTGSVAAVLGISRARAYELVHSEGFPALKIGSRIVVPKDKLREWIDANTAQK